MESRGAAEFAFCPGRGGAGSLSVLPNNSRTKQLSVRWGLAPRGLRHLCAPYVHRALHSLYPALPALAPRPRIARNDDAVKPPAGESGNKSGLQEWNKGAQAPVIQSGGLFGIGIRPMAGESAWERRTVGAAK